MILEHRAIDGCIDIHFMKLGAPLKEHLVNKRKFTSAEQKRAFEAHAAWLKANGIAPPSRKLRGVKPVIYVRQAPKTSDNASYHWPKASKDFMDPTYREAVKAKAASVAPSFNKGPLQPQTNTDFTRSGRRS